MFQTLGVRSWLLVSNMQAVRARALSRLKEDHGDLSAYLAQGVLALAAVSLTGVVLSVFSTVGTHLKDIVDSWINIHIALSQCQRFPVVIGRRARPHAEVTATAATNGTAAPCKACGSNRPTIVSSLPEKTTRSTSVRRMARFFSMSAPSAEAIR